jgi:hypothetical protein
MLEVVMSIQPITIEQAAALLGYPKPVHHRQRICAACGSDEIIWGEEFDTGHDVEMCAVCGEPTGERRWVGW